MDIPAIIKKKFRLLKTQFIRDVETILPWKIDPDTSIIIQVFLLLFFYQWDWLNVFTFESLILIRIGFLFGYNKKFWPRYAFSRIITLWFASTGTFDLPWYLGLFCFPVGISWYVFEPYLILSGRKYNDRLEYFLSRFPFFVFFGLVPGIFYLAEYWSILYLSLILLTHHQNCNCGQDSRPRYAFYIPYTSNTYNLDPLSVGEEFVAHVV